MVNVSPPVRLLLAVAITVGITLFLVRILHGRLVLLNDKDRQDKEARKQREEEGETNLPPLPPETYNLSNRVLGLVSTGFVFLLAFTLGNFWGNTADGRSATEAEAADLTRALVLANAADGGEPIVRALDTYRASVVGQQWPLMQKADASSASRTQAEVGQQLSSALLSQEATLSKTPEWPQLTSTVNDMLEQARDRIDAVPNPAAPGVLALIFALGVTNLALAATFQPARLGPNLFLMGMMATITAVMLFVVVEASNPFVGAVAVTPNGF